MDEKMRILNLGMVNAYLLKAKDGFILVDTGLPMMWEALDGQLAAAGVRPGNLKLVVITHGDWDHTGSVVRLRDKYHAKVAMHAGDVPQVENGVMLKRKVKGLVYKLFMLYRMTMMKLKKVHMTYSKFKPDILLTDGQNLAEYGIAAKIIHLPGHTPGSIGVLTDDGDLFAGDTFTNRKKPAEANIIANAGQLKNTLAKLKTMKIKTVYPGHGRPFQYRLISGS